jgi:hypothetical protein
MRTFVPKSCRQQARRAFFAHKWAKRQLGESKSKQELAREAQLRRNALAMEAEEIEEGKPPEE